MMIDFHTHILPEIDNGARNVEESIAMLQAENEQGVSIVVLTPHYYPDEQDIDTFLKLRNESYEKVLKASAKLSLPSIRLGAQVHFTPSLIEHEDLHKLCIDDTNYMLLELPYMPINSKVIDTIDMLCQKHDITPIISHFDIHFFNNSYKEIEDLMDLNILGEMDTSSIIKISNEKVFKSLLKNNYINVIGSDIHGINDKSFSLPDVYDYFKKKRKGKVFDHFMKNAKAILSNYSIDNII